MIKEYIIVGFRPDEYELPELTFDNYKEMANKLGKSVDNCRNIVNKQCIVKKLNFKFLKIELDNEDEELKMQI